MDYASVEEAFITKLVHVIQRLEREGVDITAEDIALVWKAKIYLGYSIPTSVEEGTGVMVEI